MTDDIKTGKIWSTWPIFFREHTRFMLELPSYLGAYIAPGRALDPATVESVMVTCNSVNTCPYCTGLHGQLARMAGAEPDAQAPAIKYAATFAHESGRGADERAAFEALSKELGPGKAASVRSLCWALLWGKTTGNTINATRGKLLSFDFVSLTALEMLVFFYYGFLFMVIGVLNMLLAMAPSVPAWASTLLGTVLYVPQLIHILPMGLASVAARGGSIA